MAQLSPFRMAHPLPSTAAAVAAPPFDVVSTREAARLARGNPDCFLRVSRAELEFDEPQVDVAAVYRRGARNLQRLLDDGVLIQPPEPQFGVYRMTLPGHQQTGFVGLASLTEYAAGGIRKHEQTMATRVGDRARLIGEHRSHSGLVMMFADYTLALRGLLQNVTAAPAYAAVTAGTVLHELWLVSQPEAIEQIRVAIATLTALYIADGHHRSEAAYQAWRARGGGAAADGYPVAVFPTQEVRTLSYNRVVRSLSGVTPEALLAGIRERYELNRTSAPGEPATQGFDVYVDGSWHRATPRATHGSTVHAATLLAENVLTPLLGVADARTDPRIDFVGGDVGPAALAAECDAGGAAAAFWLVPTPVAQLQAAADAREVMPAKSTWFDPKLRDGLFVHLF
jgi:uncharacterized protein (DUF1015 family)